MPKLSTSALPMPVAAKEKTKAKVKAVQPSKIVAVTQRILVVGATSAIAQQAIRLWAAQNANLYLVARDAEKLSPIAADAAVRGAHVQTGHYDTDIDAKALHALVKKVWNEWQGLDGVLVAHGWLADQAKTQDDPEQFAECIAVNGTSVIQVLAVLAPLFQKQEQGWIAAISSVAANRGRAKMYAYGAAKAMLSHVLEGLRQRLYAHNVRVIDIRPGPIDTPMTAGLSMPLVASPEAIGPALVRACATANGVVYLPWFWKYIMLVLGHLPAIVWNRVKI